MDKARKDGTLGRILVTLGRKQMHETPPKMPNPMSDTLLYMFDPVALVVQRIFEAQTEIDPLLQPILEAESSIWDASDGLSEREFKATIDLCPVPPLE